MLVVLSFLCWSALAVNQASLLDQFKEFKTRFSKIYPNQKEEVKRFNIFTENVLKAEVHNKQEDSLYTRGVNMFSDMTQEEWEATYLTGYKRMTPGKSETRMDFYSKCDYLQDSSVPIPRHLTNT